MLHARNWIRRIQAATTTAAVLELVGSFVGSIPPSELERLPREARTELGRIEHDIHAVAFELLREDLLLTGGRVDAEVLHEVADTVAAASGRLAQIEGERC